MDPIRTRPARRALHGVLLLDKPLGWTSQDALAKVRGMLRALKAGHTGTLDPLATGLLPLCFGSATKYAQAALEADKSYRATLTLGVRTTTGDGEGEVIERRPVEVDEARLGEALARFVGPIEQRPPMHSALKHQGRPLYEYARKGLEVERAVRQVRVDALSVVEWHSPSLVLDVTCSKGTYVRTLAEDIGQALGCGATLAALRRTASAGLRIAHAVTIDEIAALDDAARLALLHPADCLLDRWPAVELDSDDSVRFLCGMRRRVQMADAAAVRVYGPPAQAGCGPAFLGSAHIHAGELIADRLLSPLEVQASPQPPAAAAAPAPVHAPALEGQAP